jgi:hypothetical protein
VQHDGRLVPRRLLASCVHYVHGCTGVVCSVHGMPKDVTEILDIDVQAVLCLQRPHPLVGTSSPSSVRYTYKVQAVRLQCGTRTRYKQSVFSAVHVQGTSSPSSVRYTYKVLAVRLQCGAHTKYKHARCCYPALPSIDIGTAPCRSDSPNHSARIQTSRRRSASQQHRLVAQLVGTLCAVIEPQEPAERREIAAAQPPLTS